MKVRGVVLVSIVMAVVAIGERVIAQQAGGAAPTEINVTSDSERGWLPSAKQRQDVPKVVSDYLSSLDSGRYEQAYAMMAQPNRKAAPLPAFIERNTDFNAQAGAFSGASLRSHGPRIRRRLRCPASTLRWTSSSPTQMSIAIAATS